MPETDPATKASTTTPPNRALVVLAIVASGVFLLDQLTKFLVVQNLLLGEQLPLLGELLQLRYVRNAGAAFSLGAGSTWVFSIVAGVVAVVILIIAPRIRSVSWAALFGMLLGGNLGNLADRLLRDPGFGQGHVVDFFELWAFPAIFNFADIAIVSSMGLFILLTIRGVGFDGVRAAHRVGAPTTETGT